MSSFETYNITRAVLHISARGLYLLAFTLIVLYTYDTVSRLKEDRKIRALGGFATARAHTWAPFGLDFLYRAVKATFAHQIPEFWSQILSSAKRPSDLPPPTTVDCRVTGERIVLTIDPENVKALLAAQFNEYGKSEFSTPTGRTSWGIASSQPMERCGILRAS